MSFALRRRNLSCFYCGQKTSHKTEGKAQQFQCSNCEAVNYLDKNGQITDPPISATSSAAASTSFAHAPPRPVSPIPSDPPQEESIFCQTCIKNQHLLKENLAAYLPPEDDPRYDDYLNSYDEYRQKLEQRYPQVCASCAPKAKARIQRAAREARSDHLRRMMDKSRQHNVNATPGALVFDIILRLGGLGWAVSAISQACWHVMAAISVPQTWSMDEYEEALYTGTPSADQCAHQALNERRLHKACVSPVTAWMPYVLLLGFLTLWWNNKLRIAYSRPGSIAASVKEYYMLQVVTLLVRIAGWHFLHPDVPRLEGDLLKGGHIFMILLIALTSMISLNTIKLDLSPKVSFTVDEASMLGHVGPASTSPPRLEPGHPLYRQNTQQVFPFDKLATSSQSLFGNPAGQPLSRTAESDYSDVDAMDWTPSVAPSFNPIPLRTAASSYGAPPGPSPFHGTLPAAPRAPAHRLRQPAALQPGALRKVSDTQKENFTAGFGLRSSQTPSKGRGRRDQTDDEMTATEDEDGRMRTVGKKRREMEIANPKFWPQEDMLRNTGLETLLEESFTLAETPTGISISGTTRTKSPERAQKHSVWGPFVTATPAEAAVESVNAQRGWTNVMAIGMIPVACLGAAVLIVKGGVI